MKPYLCIVGFWAIVLPGTWISLHRAPLNVPPPTGVLAADDPVQIDITPRYWERGDAHFTALARFDVNARVLSVNHYYYGQMADISPLDLAFGWGRMSDSSVIAKMSITHGARFYYWRPRDNRNLPIPRNEVISHSANMHLIPADDNVKRILLDVEKDQIVSLGGYLVNVTKPNGWSWVTSLTRTDTGPGACEIVWVERVRAGAAQ